MKWKVHFRPNNDIHSFQMIYMYSNIEQHIVNIEWKRFYLKYIESVWT